MVNKLRLEVLLQAVDKVTGPLKRVMAGSAATSNKIKQLHSDFKAMESQHGLINNFRNSVKASAGLRAELASQQAKVKAMALEHDAAGNVTAGMARKFEKAKAEAAALKSRLQDQTQTTQRLRDKMAQAGMATSGLAEQERNLRTRMEASTAAITKQRERLKSLAEAQRKASAMAAKGATMAAAGGAAMYGGKKVMDMGLKPVGAFMQHEDAMLGIARQVQGARDEAGNLTEVYRKAEAQVRDLSTRLPQTTVQIAEMMTAAARMEVPTGELATFVELASEMATAFDAVPDEIAESMGKVAKNFKRPVTEIRGLADAINYLDDNAISKGADIIDVLNRTSGVASTVAISAEDTAALGSTLLTLGERAETASTAINAIFTKFAAATKGTKKFKAAVGEIGMTPAQIQNGMAKDAAGTLEKVSAAIAKLPKKNQIGVMAELVGLEHSDTLAKLVQQPEELRRQRNLANGPEGKGSMAKEASARNSTLSAQTLTEQNRLFNSMAVAGEQLKTPLLEIYKTLNPLLEKFTAWMQANPAIVGGVLKLVVGAGLLMGAMGALLIPLGLMLAKGAILRFMFARLGLSFANIGTAMRLVGSAFTFGGQWLGAFGARVALYIPAILRFGAVFLRLLGPIGLVITAATMLYQRWDDVVGGAKLLWADLTSAIGSGLQAVMGLTSQFFNAGANIIQGLVSGITSRIAAVRDAVGEVASSSIGWFKERLGIHSPSRVFAELGGYVGEGAAQGIAGSSGLVRNAALGMAAATLVPMGAMALPMGGMLPMPDMASMAAPAPVGGTASGGGASTYIINITVQGNAKGDEIGAAVRAEIERLERQKAARRGSSLTDLD
ncbi:phage tail tape measure protein [Comamonas koreensis]|uniref:phage tail tape measure protein n=1 Tax=Comamonas koreensis TaxID=160825 RepID=UPI0015F973E3|nr:phage tail tape measure protein [Comamonas koreensis]